MNNVISKELLSLVVGRKVTPSHVWDSNLEYSFMVNSIKHSQSINIYELAHKCKELAFNTENYIIVEYEDRCSVFSTGGILVFTSILEQLNDYIFNPNRVFICAQWILDNKDNQ